MKIWLVLLILLTGCSMIYDGKEIGGAAHGPATLRFNGSIELCQTHIYDGRLLLGTLKHQMELGGIKNGQVDQILDDGTKLHAQSNRYGLADIDEIWIDVSALATLGNVEPQKVLGFVAHVSGRVFGKGTGLTNWLEVSREDTPEEIMRYYYTWHAYGGNYILYDNTVISSIPPIREFNSVQDTIPWVGSPTDYNTWLLYSGDFHYPRVSNPPYHYAYSPTWTQRNKYNNVLMVADPKILHKGRTIEVAPTITEGVFDNVFVAVLPWKVSYIYADHTAWISSYKEVWGDRDFTLNDFDGTGKAKNGRYVIRGMSQLEITLETTDAEYKINYDLGGNRDTEITIDIGVPFKDISEVVKQRPYTKIDDTPFSG